MAENRRTEEARRRSVRLLLEYDGTDFSGWQRQVGRRTVQEALEEAMAKVTGERVSVLASGRTDSGVHAEGQVANFRTQSVLPPERLMAAINANLAEDVAVLSAEDVEYSFHATRDAKGKLYRYRLSTREVRPVLERRRSWWVRDSLDVAAMKAAAAHLVGKHDFNAFRNEGSVEKNTVRTIESIEFVESPGTLEMYFRGGGFLYMMLRIIVGTLVKVGQGRLEPDAISAILVGLDRSAAGPTAPAHGLCLVEVYY